MSGAHELDRWADDGGMLPASPERDGRWFALGLRGSSVDPALNSIRDALAEIAAERLRQIESEGFDAAHDDRTPAGDLSRAAACYVLNAGLTLSSRRLVDIRSFWPWPLRWWKPRTPHRDLVRSAALIVAELERLRRADQRRTNLKPKGDEL